MTNVYDLTDDVLLEIFLYINVDERIHLERVCNQWRRVIQQMWRSMRKLVYTVAFSKYCKKKLNEKAIDRGCRIFSRDISDFSKILSLFDGNLTKLHFVDDTCAEEDLPTIKFDLLQKNTNLTSIKIQSCNEPIMNGFLSSLPSAKRFQHLSINGCCNREVLQLIEKILVEAQELNYLHLGQISMPILSIICNLKKLKSLHIRYGDNTLESLRLLSCSSKLPHLVSLSIYDSNVVDNNFLRELAINYKQLRYLTLGYYDHSSDDGLNAIGRLENLCYLKIRSVAHHRFLRQLTNLEVVDIDFSADIFDYEGYDDILMTLWYLKKLQFYNFGDNVIPYFISRRVPYGIVGYTGECVDREWDNLFAFSSNNSATHSSIAPGE